MDKIEAGKRQRLIDVTAAGLFPGYFALVMATGIIAAGSNAFGLKPLAKTLLIFAGVAYLWLWVLTVIRLASHRGKLVADICSPQKAPAFFTTVAATGVLGAAQLRIFGSTELSLVLYGLTTLLWIVVIYGVVSAAIVSRPKPPVGKSISGAWLTLVVGTQAVSILGSLVAKASPDPTVVIFLSGLAFALGCACYAAIIILIIARLVFLPLDPEDLTPPYWITMGGAAISCLAGIEFDKASTIWTMQIHWPMVIQSFTLAMWVTATAWLPTLVILGSWRHAVGKVPLTYDPQYWSMVFPLGMYAFTTHSLALQYGFLFLDSLAAAFLGFALLAWSITLLGLGRRVVRNLVSERMTAVISNPAMPGHD